MGEKLAPGSCRPLELAELRSRDQRVKSVSTSGWGYLEGGRHTDSELVQLLSCV